MKITKEIPDIVSTNGTYKGDKLEITIRKKEIKINIQTDGTGTEFIIDKNKLLEMV